MKLAGTLHLEKPAVEAARLRALEDLHILDTAPEDAFDEATHMAATICGAPIAVVNLIDAERVWVKSGRGFDIREAPRAHAFCNHLVGTDQLLIVPDASSDVRFASNPFVLAEGGLRFYAGMPLNTPDGHTVGSLCVADVVPRELTAGQAAALSALGRQVAMQLELRAKNQLLNETVQQNERVSVELRQRNRLFSAFMEHSPGIGFIKDRQGRFVYYNRMFCERFAVSSTEWIGKSVFDLFPEEFARGYHDMDMRVMETGTAEVIEESSPGPDGSTLYWRSHKFPVVGDDGELLLGGLSFDISQERETALRLEASHQQLELANRQLTQLAATDGLTALLNRRAFDTALHNDMTADRPLSLLLFDVDHFKRLNDTFGHAAGDTVLRGVAHLLQKDSRTSDCVARIGGEEFAILLRGAGIREALALAERLRESVATHPFEHGRITISAGVATRCTTLNSSAGLLDAADNALYNAKRAGRNCVHADMGSLAMLQREEGTFRSTVRELAAPAKAVAA